MMRYERRNRHLWVFKTKTQIKEVRKKKGKEIGINGQKNMAY